MTALTWDIEMNLGGWASVKADLATAAPIEWFGGCYSSDPIGIRCATTGMLTFTINNAASNSGSKLGYYSPDHANIRASFGLGTEVRMSLTYSGTTTYWKYYITDISPVAGAIRDRYSFITCTDYMDVLASRRVSLLAVQFGATSDTLYAAIIAALDTAPEDTDFMLGADRFAYSFHDLLDERNTALTAINRVAISGLEYFYLKADTTAGELLVNETRHARLLNDTPAADLDDTMMELSIQHNKGLIYNIVTCTAHPLSYDTSPVILSTLQREIKIAAGATLDPVVFRYRDPTGAATRVAGYDMITPVATTDYKMFSRSDGAGTNITSDLSLATTFGGNSASVVFTNGNAGDGFINFTNLRGYGIYTYDPVDRYAEDSTSITAYGPRELNINLPYQDNPNVAQDFADWILSNYKDPATNIDSVTFCANTSATLMGYGCALDIGNRVTITETVTGLDDDFFVNSIKRRIDPGGVMYVTLGALEACRDVGLWMILDTGELDTNTLAP